MDGAARGGTLEAGSIDGGRAGGEELTAADGFRTTNRLKASIVDLTFLVWAVAAPVAFASRMVNSDGDLARHIAMGEYTLRNGLITHDHFSFTAAGTEFLTYEWLSTILYALFHRLGGVAGVAICAGLVIATAYALIVLFMRRQGVDPLLAYLVGIVAAVIGAAHWLARPHLFTFVMIALLLFLMHARDRRALLLFPLLFAVWANLHPGFVVGFMILGAYTLGELAEAWLARAGDPERRGSWFARARLHGLGILLGAVATFLTPHGWKLHHHIVTYLGSDIVDVTSEFLSVNFHAVHGKLFLAVLLVLVGVLALRRERLSLPTLFLLLLMLYAALFAQRNIPIFGLAMLPLLAIELNGDWMRLANRRLGHVRRVFREGEALAAPGRWFAPVSIAMLLLALNHGRVAGAQLVPDGFNPEKFPIEAVEYAKQNGLERRGRMFHELLWGGYMLYAWPEQRIFIDGLTDHFGEDLMWEYLKIIMLEPGWDVKLQEYDISLAMMWTKSPMAYALQRDAGWKQIYSDSTAMIFERSEQP